MPRVKSTTPRRNHVPNAIIQHSRARRTRRLYRELATLFESLSIPIRIRFVHGRGVDIMQRLDSMGGFRVYGPPYLPPTPPPSPPLQSSDEVSPEDTLSASENSPVIPYTREALFPSFSSPLFPTTPNDDDELFYQPER